MAETVHLEVVTRRRRVLAVDADFVELPGVLGALGVLPGHTPLLTALGIGELMYRSDHAEEYLAVRGGFAEILPDRVTVLAEAAEEPGEIDIEAALRERKEAEAALRTADAAELDRLRARLQLAVTRLQVAGRAGRGRGSAV